MKKSATRKHQWKRQWKILVLKIDQAKRESSRLFLLSKKKYQKTLRDLEQRRRELNRQLKKFGARGDVAWTDVKRGFRAAAGQVDRAVKRAMADLQATPRTARRKR